MKVAVVGCTGMVGRIMLSILEERNFPVSELIPVASEQSVGKTISFKGKAVQIVSMEEAVSRVPDFALFSAGGETSLEWAPKFAEKGTRVVDNSSAWRMESNVPLAIPEVNPHVLDSESRIIANPNCSTIQMLVALAPLHEKYGIKRLVISTYQSVTGTGKAAVNQMEQEAAGLEADKVYPYAIHKNALPHCDVFVEDAYTKEETKLVNETRKILGDPTIGITATCVRVPVQGGHSESVNVEFKKEFDLAELRALLQATPGVIVQDNPSENDYPMPLYAEGKDEVFVGRLRRDLSQEKTLNMWIVSDNLRKGAATNTVQIAEYLVERFKKDLANA